MKLLLDTHIFLWWITDNHLLSSNAHGLIEDTGNDLFLSAASGWEIAIKAGLEKIILPDNPILFIEEQMTVNQIYSLPIELEHALHIYRLPLKHKDPFDRILVAQAQIEGLVIISNDKYIQQYDVEVVW
ncbi:MAG: type II toxin-antitoxin system VapC family toxin [Candidatus Magnetoovum sp. WYHC-5]|nr:type II toxin-antitoxin system VapC family toxin [Candidatus Magnetoovum sp. WYHC-5]